MLSGVTGISHFNGESAFGPLSWLYNGGIKASFPSITSAMDPKHYGIKSEII